MSCSGASAVGDPRDASQETGMTELLADSGDSTEQAACAAFLRGTSEPWAKPMPVVEGLYESAATVQLSFMYYCSYHV